MSTLDTLGRPLRSLRLSVTDRCNLRCHYCMPEDEYVWLPREDVLTFEETVRLADLCGEMGVDRVRLTGGEPLLRRDLCSLVAQLASRPWLTDLALTTNAVLLADAAAELKTAGLGRVTVSLDTVRRDRFVKLARIDALPQVLAGIDAVRRVGFEDLKIDSVITRGDNDDELGDLLEYGRSVGAEVRFIEYMDVGGATHWRPESVFSRAEMLEQLSARYGPISQLPSPPAAPADRFSLPDGLAFGIIASTTQPFCRTCDRARLTADGVLLLCLYAQHGTDLRRPLRAGASRETLLNLLQAVWKGRADRGAEERRSVRDRSSYIPLRVLKRDAHLEMHTRGG
ncbi:MAG: GTP 3',8-cyclase MoaA [Acidobacteria bacterium]|jgi:GTP 3',8-cyclase|nr:GTP 3',8-cyclase MoaA [Acidobacteriota bacterium]